MSDAGDRAKHAYNIVVDELRDLFEDSVYERVENDHANGVCRRYELRLRVAMIRVVEIIESAWE